MTKTLPTGAHFRASTFQTTPQDVDEILKNAGLSRQDLLKLTYDAEVYGCLERRLSAVIATEWALEGQASTDIIDKLKALLGKLHEPLVRAVMLGKWLGLSFTEVVYQKLPDGGLTISELIPRPQSAFVREQGVWYFKSAMGDKIRILEGKLLINGVNVHENNPFGDALLSRVYWSWFAKRQGEQFYAKFAERHASPLSIVKTNLNTLNPVESSHILGQLASAVAQAVSAGTIALDAQDEVQLIQANSDGEAHIKFLRHHIQSIQKTLLGRVLTSELENGSRAAQETDEQFVLDIYESDLSFCESALNELAHFWALANGFNFNINVEYIRPKTIDKERYERDVALMQTGQIQFTAQYYQNHYDLDAADFVLSSPPSVPSVVNPSLSLGLSGKAPMMDSTPATRELDKHYNELEDWELDTVLSLAKGCASEFELSQRLALYYQEQMPDLDVGALLKLAQAQGYADAVEGKT